MKLALRIFTLAAALGILVLGTALAQNPPQVPGASQRAGNGGTTAAAASLRGPGGGALEPYLITWLLPGLGIISVLAAVAADRRLRAGHR